jgi:predicted nucleotidyltransferase
MSSPGQPLRTHAREIHRIAERHGAVRVRVFGSHATGVATATSDVDLLVVLAPDRDLLDLIGLKQDLEALLALPVDVVEEGGLSPHLRERILAQAKPL